MKGGLPQFTVLSCIWVSSVLPVAHLLCSLKSVEQQNCRQTPFASSRFHKIQVIRAVLDHHRLLVR